MLDQVAATATLALSRADAWLPHVAALIIPPLALAHISAKRVAYVPLQRVAYPGRRRGKLLLPARGRHRQVPQHHAGSQLHRLPGHAAARGRSSFRQGLLIQCDFWFVNDKRCSLRELKRLISAEQVFTAGNEQVQTMAISTIRGALSNMTVVEVMTQRETLTKRVKQDITLVFRGWGIWLETVEILDVRVESKSLFDDMQYLKTDALDFDTKADAHLAAEKAPIAVKTALEGEKVSSSLAMAKKRADAASAQGIHEAEQSLRREEGEAKLEEAKQELRLARLAKEQVIKLKQLSDEIDRQNKSLEQSLAVEKAKDDATHELRQRRYTLDASLTKVNLEKEMIDATKEVYARLPISEVKLVSFAGGGGGAQGLRGLLPQVVEAMEAVDVVSQRQL
eukprot:CAMPEP_0180411022 /NCGR_PEP_ID=MMETSP0989-20121125/43742_1 /TAXON_ID=697907 /ORGANISM="non described non described, Strain CCMP2293" /LENGTH=394 /DNA_ID=CAMNT_0022415307 /DNA_START=288 /DNA_END=1473 /DNA_ORIENTATION=-